MARPGSICLPCLQSMLLALKGCAWCSSSILKVEAQRIEIADSRLDPKVRPPRDRQQFGAGSQPIDRHGRQARPIPTHPTPPYELV
jgi:hypothetical protein